MHAPDNTVYVIIDVPAAIPDTTPDAFIVATPEFELTHVPPLFVLDHVAEAPTHNAGTPEIVSAVGADMVTVCVAVLTHAPDVTV